MSFENQTESEPSVEQLNSEIDKLTDEGRNTEALELAEKLPDGHKKFEEMAFIGKAFVEEADLESAQKVFELLEKNEDFPEYAGYILELILRAKGEIE